MRREWLTCWTLLAAPLRRRWCALAAVALLAAVLELATAALLLRLITRLERGADDFAGDALTGVAWLPETAGALALIFAALLVAKTSLRLAETQWRERLTARTVDAFSVYLLGAWLGAPLRRQLSVTNPAIIEDVQSASLLAGREGIASVILIVSEGLVVLTLTGVMIALSPPAALGLIAGLLVLAGGLLRLAHRRHDRRSAEILEARVAAQGFLQGALAGARELRLAGAVPVFVQRFAKIRARVTGPLAAQEVWRQAPLFIFEALALLAAAVFLFLLRGTDALPLFVVAVYAALRLLPAINRLVYRAFALQGARAGFRRLLDAPTPASRRDGAPAAFDRSLELKDASLIYPGNAAPALSDVNLTLRPGECVAIVGPSGHGKSTLLQVLAGLLALDRGEVLADGNSVTADDPAWQALVGYVGQESPLLDDTLRLNITLGDREADAAALREAVALARLEPVLERLPAGLDTPIGPGGRALSGGERQRVALARCFYRRPRLLLLDEATAFLDPPTELAVMAGLAAREQPPAVVFITHRLATARRADRVIFVEHGRIAGSGSFETLRATQPAFAAFAAEVDAGNVSDSVQR
ncbi:MAG TPA: ABC transporter ATP-binding protein [Opitutus sp.]|nr:ABC transporter ATP-binding protein [Opitutus sp.]